MTGRAEHENKVNQKIEDMIKDYPDYLEDFDISMQAEGLTHNTRKSYMGSVLRYLNYLKEEGKDIWNKDTLRAINSIDIKKYFVKKHYKDEEKTEEKSGSYINMEQRGLSFFFRYLVECQIIEKNPFRVDGQPIKIGKPKDTHVTVALDNTETKTMYNNIDSGVGSHRAKARQEKWKDRDMAIVDLALNTGLRVSALTEINISDIDFANQTINVVEKGNKSTKVEFDSQTANLLKTWIAKREKIMGADFGKTDALFISNRRQRIAQNSVDALVKKYSNGIPKHITAHKLRASFATAVMVETNDQHMVQTALNHSGDVTDRYLGNKDEEKRKAVGAARRYYNRTSTEEEQHKACKYTFEMDWE